MKIKKLTLFIGIVNSHHHFLKRVTSFRWDEFDKIQNTTRLIQIFDPDSGISNPKEEPGDRNIQKRRLERDFSPRNVFPGLVAVLHRGDAAAVAAEADDTAAVGAEELERVEDAQEQEGCARGRKRGKINFLVANFFNRIPANLANNCLKLNTSRA